MNAVRLFVSRLLLRLSRMGFKAWLGSGSREAAELKMHQERERREELDRLERRDQLDLLRSVVMEMSASIQSQNKVMAGFLEGFKSSGTPQMREYDESEEIERYLDRRATPSTSSPEKQLHMLETLLSKIDTDEPLIFRD